ncbi:MAG: hypothetical protein HYZ84_01360 [Candidatus Omnitrophica bacterium]|nr:hypothetical protein [Candidatus Omnitrophota bacterium]
MAFSIDFKKIFKSTLLVFVFSLIFNPLALALAIPSELGYVQEEIPGQNGKTLILIQEAHADYGAQKSIAGILQSLIENHALRLILVEGGWGNVSLTYFRKYADAKSRLEVSERYLQAGKISGEEYLNIISDFNMELWGVENHGLYEENMRAFLSLEDRREHLAAELSKLEAVLNTLKEKTYSPALLELDRKKHAFDEGTLALTAYLPFLIQDEPALAADFPQIKNFLSLLGQEGSFDPEKVEWEKQNAMKSLSKSLTKPEFEAVQRLSLDQKKGSREELELIHMLLELSASKGKNKQIANLKVYGKVLEEMMRSESRHFFAEVDRLEAHRFDRLALQEEEKELLKTVRAFLLIKKLFNLKLSPENFDSLAQSPQSYSPLSLKSFLTGKAPSEQLPDFEFLEACMPDAKAFYESARKREQAMIQNTIKKMGSEKDKMTALIVGGFHSQPVMQGLHEKGYSVIMISPRFMPDKNPEKQHEQYLKILKEKGSPEHSQNPIREMRGPVLKTS